MGKIKRIRSKEEGNLLIIKKNIVFEKDLSGNTRFIFMAMWQLPDDWDFTIKGFASAVGINENTVRRSIGELIKKGYILKDEKNTGDGKNVIYHLFESLEDNREKILHPDDLQGCDLQGCKMHGCKSDDNKTINNKTTNIIKHIIDKPYPKKEFLGDCENQKSPNKGKMDTSKMDSQNVLEKLNKKELEKVAPVKTPAQARKEERALKRKQKLQNKIEQEQNKEMKSIQDLAEMTLNEQTVEESILANAKRLNNAAQEALNEVKRRDGRKSAVKTRIQKLIDTEIKDKEMRELLKSFVSMWMNVGKKMTEEVYTQQLSKLYELSPEIEIQKKIVRKSIEHCWLGFYPLETNYKKDTKEIKPQPVFISESQEVEYAKDENGNILLY